MKPNCPNGFSFEKISTFISLPIIQDSGNNGHEQQNTNKFFIFILISKQRFTRGYKRYKETSGLMEWKIGHIFHSIFT